MNREEASKQTGQLVQLAQRLLHGASPLSDEAGFSRLAARMAPHGRSRLPFWAAAGLGLASAAALAVTLYVHAGAGRPLTFAVAGGAVGAHGQIVGKEATRIHFSDGSEAELARGTEAEIAHLTEHGADVRLVHGSMRVSIAKKPQALWRVAAGPYDVRVTGTAFDVSWSNQAQAFDLKMQTGAVIVTGPFALAGIPLRAGQHMFGGVVEGRLTVEGGDARTAPPAEPTDTSAEATAMAPATGDGAAQVAPALSAPARSVDVHAWARQVAQGHFGTVLEQAEQRGLDRTLATGSSEELAALADAARYAGRSSVARRVLLAERQRFAGSSSAKDAAFFLGRIAEDSGGGAIEWYERYVSESPRGSYASQAFGRKMMLVYKQHGASAARVVAGEYLNQYPNGPYAAAARKIQQELASATRP